MRYDIGSPQQQLLIQKMIPQVNIPYQQDYESRSHVDQMHMLSLSIISLTMNETYSFA